MHAILLLLVLLSYTPVKGKKPNSLFPPTCCCMPSACSLRLLLSPLLLMAGSCSGKQVGKEFSLAREKQREKPKIRRRSQ